MLTGRHYAVFFGIVLVLVGAAGYMPQFMQGNLLFGHFLFNSTQSNIHLITGLLALLASLNERHARFFFQFIGIIYAIMAVFGFLTGKILGMPVNVADNILYVIIAVFALLIGFLSKKSRNY